MSIIYSIKITRKRKKRKKNRHSFALMLWNCMAIESKYEFIIRENNTLGEANLLRTKWFMCQKTINKNKNIYMSISALCSYSNKLKNVLKFTNALNCNNGIRLFFVVWLVVGAFCMDFIRVCLFVNGDRATMSWSSG